MTLVVSRWRAWLAFCALGSAVSSGYRGEWAWAGVAAAFVLLPAALRVRAKMADTRRMMLMLQRPGRLNVPGWAGTGD